VAWCHGNLHRPEKDVDEGRGLQRKRCFLSALEGEVQGLVDNTLTSCACSAEERGVRCTREVHAKGEMRRERMPRVIGEGIEWV
jgi:hypothetical protein